MSQEIIKIDKTDLEILKVIILKHQEIGLDVDTLFKVAKICKIVLDENNIRYFLSFYKAIVHFNSTTYITRFIIFDYNKDQDNINIVLQL